MPTKDGLIVAADTRSVLVSASLGMNKACDGESKLVELAMVERTVVAFVGSRRLFFLMSVFSAQDPCAEIERVPVGSVGLDARSVVQEYLDQDGIVINKSRLKSFSEQFVAKVNSLDLSPLLKTRARKSLFQISVGSYDVRARKSLIGTFKAKHAYFETVAARLEALELRQNHSIQITAEKSLGDNLWQK
jgi:hypothetical protein